MSTFRNLSQSSPKSKEGLGALKRCDLFGFIRHTMQVAAMYPCRDLFKICLPTRLHCLALFADIFYEWFTVLVVLHIAIMYICTLYLFWDDGDLEFLVNCFIQTIIYIWALGMKMIFRRFRKAKLWDLMETINDEHRVRSAEGFTYVTVKGSLDFSTKYIKVFVYCCCLGTAFWALIPIAYGDRSLPLACWYPLDYKAPIVYEIIFFLQFVGQIEIGSAFAASSGFYMILNILISGQYDILFCSLKNILATTYLEMDVTRNQLEDLKDSQSVANAEVNQYYCSKEIEVSIDFLKSRSEMNNRNSVAPFKKAFRNSFRDCVHHHWFILRSLRKTESFYNPIWYVKIGEVIILLCLVMFVAVKSTSANSFMKMVSLGQYVFLVIWELLIICYFGEIVYLNSQRSAEALLRSPWYTHMREMKSDILLFLLNSKKPFRLTAGKMYRLDIDRFRTVITTTFSFLTLLQKMDDRH